MIYDFGLHINYIGHDLLGISGNNGSVIHNPNIITHKGTGLSIMGIKWLYIYIQLWDIVFD